MDAHEDETRGNRGHTDEPTAFERFESLAKRLLHVSKDDVREAEVRERDKRRTA